MAGQSRLASISDYGSVQSSSWMENVDDTLSHITEKVWVNLNVWSFLWWTSFQYCRPSGLQCTSHFVFRSSPPASRTTLSRPQAEKQWKESQNAARFCAFCTLLKQDFPVSTHQSRSVCDLCWICRFFAWKYARAHCDILHSKERTSGARQLQDRETCWFHGGINVTEVFGGLESYDDDWCLMFDDWCHWCHWCLQCHVTVCHLFICFLRPGLEWSFSFLVLAIQHDLCPPAQV